ncbi:tRNA (N6-threonylcarbamoyladenosine(37)-N6)-methyltransferase TrmO [Sulfuriferula nivalis]|uniref:tRNA (N6-threonylcarbamoyladenosine(37)-N6)-methyltransferase TrmO n=1 Tax=Sulfuriferula nivalis TaxID=2675298 RepID=A0A809RCK4_9PROT|nr:tRNA (N6-threonylcarbamoyladenosine(37)-N6)-methyltransferase TrmO [Sulfuriferula nivalis]BBO99374.1 tRNA (N6-threonylcarbamoyladenosine(37)-N6)-methyltransferase TrmO [Sulfuriferula nivalis]
MNAVAQTVDSNHAYIMQEEITVQPIGHVRSEIIEPIFGGWRDHISQIVLDPAHAASLQGLLTYSHVMVVFWMHYVCYSKSVHVPQAKELVPEVGIFACRCPARPNPVGCTTVRLLEIKDNILTLQGLDAVHETPIIDIKPVTPQYDCTEQDEIRVPDWIFRLDY